MTVTSFPTLVSTALALGLVAGATLGRAAADELDVRPAVATVERLVPQCELDAVSLNIVDEKLALSLAVETHIQIELTQYALAGIRHDGLKQFTEKKLRLYRQLLSTLEELTGGRAGKVLSRASRKTEVATSNGDAPLPPAPAADSRGPARASRKGGFGDIVQNATASAVLRVRLEIADAYAHLLRAELETAPPSEFDRRYLVVEAFNQMQVLAMLRVFEQHASPEFARVIRLATIAAESHVAEVAQVIEQFKAVPQDLTATPSQAIDTAGAAGP